MASTAAQIRKLDDLEWDVRKAKADGVSNQMAMMVRRRPGPGDRGGRGREGGAVSKPTWAQRKVLAAMAEGAAILVDYDRRWVLKLRNDVLPPVSKPMRRGLRQNGWTHESWADECYRITDAGRVALAATTPAAGAAGDGEG